MSNNFVEKVLEEGEEILRKEEPLKKANRYWRLLGPGLTTGAADDDPSGVATYSQTGARYGFNLLWLSVFTFPLMAVVLEMCARIGLVTGRGLARNIRLFFPGWVLYSTASLLFLANTINIGANLGAMAKAFELIFPDANFYLVVIGFTTLSLILQIFSTYEKYARYLKYLALVLFSYVIGAFFVNMDWQAVVYGAFVPTIEFSSGQLVLICAILGTTISPYLFFWQTSQEVEEEIMHGKITVEMRQEVNKKDIGKMRIDVWSGMFISNLVMFFIIATTAAALHAYGITNIETADQAAIALRPIAGEFTYILFALGIIGVGMLAVPVLAGSASYALTESFGWREGLSRSFRKAYGFYGVIIVSTVVGMIMNFAGIDSIKALIFSAVVNGLIAPVVLVLIVILSSNKSLMGEYVNSRGLSSVGWFVIILMTGAGMAAILSLWF